MKMYTKENLAFLLVKPVMGPFAPQISYEKIVSRIDLYPIIVGLKYSC